MSYNDKFAVIYEDTAGVGNISECVVKDGSVFTAISSFERAVAIMVMEAGRFITEHKGSVVDSMGEDFISVKYPERSLYGNTTIRKFSIEVDEGDPLDPDILEYRYSDYDCE